ncbi:neurotrypsin-like [Patiria miniata]|uniref:SRCR domain-containing protein n=1 Tax=Patiria miniata TaxID=46514 RepID=A0A913ZTQ4_PATMI|nr:neurotrypsin-like [Patiria miniata]XP_038054451.1 neurotrypsin-like [Patiria miniata]
MFTGVMKTISLAWLLETLILGAFWQSAKSQSDGDFRLNVSIPGSNLKKLEVFFVEKWGPVCANNWQLRESMVLCNQLGFQFVGSWGPDAEDQGVQGNLGYVNCQGDESSILDCSHMKRTNTSGPYCLVSGVVAMTCVETRGQGAQVSFVDGDASTEGRVEVRFQNGDTTFVYSICDEGWDLADADIACTTEEPPNGPALEAVGGSYFGEHPSASGSNEQFDGYLASGLQCDASATYENLIGCPNSGWFPKNCNKNAGVKCQRKPDALPMNITLIDGTSNYEGFVKVTLSDTASGSICSQKVLTLREGDVVCRSLGYGYALSVSEGKSSLQPVVFDLHCDGNEQSLTECVFNAGGNCDRGNTLEAKVTCSGPLEANKYPVELTDQLGARDKKGLLRVFRDGRWGTVCKTGWTKEDAQVVCRQLGYSSVVSYVSEDESGSGPIYLSNVDCDGTEQSLDQCQHDGLGVHEGCSHMMDVYVECGSAMMVCNAILIAALASLAKFLSSQ